MKNCGDLFANAQEVKREVRDLADAEIKKNKMGGYIHKEGYCVLMDSLPNRNNKHIYPHWYRGFK